MNIYEKLLNVQTELKAPKGQFNAFGKYKYRSCEDILEALKPVLNKYKLTFFINDEIVEVNNRNYVKATITIINIEKPDEQIQTSALAREEETKKGMDGSQITGASSSYARKYALNGMFMIDDTKDSDSTNTHGKDKTEQEKVQDFLNSRNGMIEKLSEYVKGDKLERMLKNYGVKELFEMKDEQLKDACKKIFDKKVS
ncbi:ERF family protein [uncultured Fusobacterium sp.]|jgi:essential recombination function protein|uniref:ERF family protein n=1 Tax=uncultured Fusobacterium sp. TaxID=159267 RepID=UPI0025DD936B|nr:ERF family protein [uncultured Fusobacterium sp.]